ncbi:MAG: hypothetical protein PHF97_03285 [Bacteroidales bacterium]|nr:hypothetical protein [Bacteroidales bacterium]MDD4602818.1 hypothetical protein [Bacteroidales bacterium]
MIKKYIILILIIFFGVFSGYSQKVDSLIVKRNHYSFTIGGGWTHYINSLEIGKKDARINFAGISLKFFWEPEHRLSLGLETGFYQIYKVKINDYMNVTGQAGMSAIPLLLTVRMRIVDHFHLSVGAGLAMMFNKVSGMGQNINSTILSLSNYQFSGSYIYPLHKHWLVGGEFKVLDFGKADDWIYSVQAICTIRL